MNGFDACGLKIGHIRKGKIAPWQMWLLKEGSTSLTFTTIGNKQKNKTKNKIHLFMKPDICETTVKVLLDPQ